MKFSADATVRLRVIDPYNVSNNIEKTLQLYKANKKTDVCIDCENKEDKLEISAVLANPPRADTVEWIEIENISSETISLDFCKISDESRSYIMSGMLVPHGTIRLRQAVT